MRQAVPASARVAAFAALAALCGCAALGFGGGERAVRSTSLPVELATWVAADVCRGTFPSADPNPLHDGAPVVRHDPGHFEVISGRSWHEAYRCAMNGRVRGPRARLRDGELAFEGAHFIPSPHFTDVRGSSDAVFVSIEVGPDSTTVVTWTYGEPGAENLARHIDTVLSILEVAERSHGLTARGEWAETERYLERELARLVTDCCSRHQSLLSVLFAHLATALERRGDLTGARIALAKAVDRAPELQLLRARLARLDDRMASSEEAQQSWHLIAHAPSSGLLGPLLVGRLNDRLELAAGNTQGFVARERGAELLRAGDLPGALAWAARLDDVDTERPLELRAELFRTRGEHRIAFALGQIRLRSHGFDAELVFRLNRDSMAFGDPTAGLRLLARYWRELEHAAPLRYERVMRVAATSIERSLVCRILVSEDCTALGAEHLARWAAEGGGDPSGVGLLSRVEALRGRVLEPAGGTAVDIPIRPFENAPGVAPMR